MKRLFTLAIVALIATMAFAQSQQAQRRVPYTSVERAMQVGLLGPQAHADAVAKANAVNEVGATRLVRGNNSVAAYQQLSLNDNVLTGAKLGKVVPAGPYKAPAKVTETEGNLTITKDEHGIITNVEGVAAQYYQRSTDGQAFYPSNNQLYIGNQSGVATIVMDGNNVYMLNPISRYEQGSWVKGVKEGNTITVATKQPLYYSGSYDATVSLRWGTISAAGSLGVDDDHAEAFTFTIDGDVITLEGCEKWDQTADIFYMGAFWDDDNSNTGYGDAATVLTLDSNYTPPSTTLVEVPEGITEEDWYLNAVQLTSSSSTKIKNQEVVVAFDGNDVYVQGIFTFFPDAWVKGTKDGDAYAFDNLQFIGTYGTNNIWMVGVDEEGNLIAPKAAYDATANTLAFDCDVLANAADNRIYYLTYLSEVVLSADEVEFEEPILNPLTATLPYVNTFETEAEQNEVAIYDANEDNSTFSFVQEGSDNIAARYRYSTSNVGDDYLVFPNVQLEAGKKYAITVDVHTYNERYPEIVTVLCGKESKASALNIEVIEATTVATKEYITLSNGEFGVAESGMYSFAVKAISEPDQFYLYVDNFSIKEVNLSSPAAPTDLEVTPDANGANKAIVTVTAPAKDLKDDNLTGDLNMVIKVDGVEAVTKTVAAGAAVSEEITVEAPGFCNVSVVFSQNGASSDPVSVKVYIGVDTPTAVTDLEFTDKSNAVGMSWNAPTEGVNNGIIFPDQLTYDVYPVELVEFWGMIFPTVDTDNPYATDIVGTSYDVEYNTNEGDMQFTYFAVAPKNEAGQGSAVYKALVTGAPYAIPVKESVAGKTLSYWWATNSDDDNYYADGGLYFGENPSDNDGWNFQFIGMTAGYVTVESGKVALGGASNPVVQFDAVNTLGNSKVEVSVLTSEGETLLKTVTPTSEYATYTVSLVDYKDAPWVRVVIKGVFEGEASASGDPIAIIDVDNIKIVNLLDKNLAVFSFNAPAKVEAGQDIVATVVVENQGALAAAAADYTVKFTVNGKENEVAGIDLAADQRNAFEYTIPTSLAGAESFTVKAEVVYAADEDQTNNASAEATVKVAMPKYPTVANVNATVAGTTVTLTWDEPDLENITPEAVTEDFESYEPFQFGNAIGDWTLVDGDGTAMGGLQNTDVPNLNIGSTTGSFFVVDRDVISAHVSWDPANGGKQYLSTMFAYEPAPLDDWLISPALPGIAQSISFYAKSYSGDYKEEFEVLYSTTDMAPASFVKIDGVAAVPEEWAEYSYDLPEGAKYFAIHCISNDKFMLFVDDITYIPANGVAADLEIVGYNVYRDGVKVNAEPVAETNFVDADLADNTDYLYAVSAVYTQGESKAVEAQNGVTTGIKQVDVENGEATYYNLQGVQIAKPAAGTTCIRVINGNAVKVIIR